MIIIDPGHGGSDPGGGNNQHWLEKDLTLKISLYQYNRLKELRIPVYLTRDSDITLNPTNRINTIKNIIGNNKNPLIISNHINVDLGLLDGADIYHSKFDSDKFSKIIGNNFVSVGQNVRGIYTRENSKGLDYYYIIRDTRPHETVLIEYGFADSPYDDVQQLLNNWEALAEAVVKSIAEYKGYHYTSGDYSIYTVKSGDSLYKISNIYNVSINDIKSLNNLTSNTIYPGMNLKIPSRINIVNYTVKSGDSLYKIATTFNTSINDIKSLNNLTSNTIYPGMNLKVPSIYNITEYNVVYGDTLYGISRRFNTSIKSIMDYNNLVNTNLYVGQKLLIPF